MGVRGQLPGVVYFIIGGRVGVRGQLPGVVVLPFTVGLGDRMHHSAISPTPEKILIILWDMKRRER